MTGVLSTAASRAVATVVTGVVGAAVYDAVRSTTGTAVARSSAVGAIALALRGARAAEVGAERLRLGTGDLVAEARERVGEQAAPPVAGEAHDHDH